MVEVYRKRIRQFFFASVAFLNLVFFASVVLYPFFKLPIPNKLVAYLNFFVTFVGVLCVVLGYILKKKLFPILSSKDLYWSYKATRRYFWLFVLVNVPFLISFIVYIILAPLSTLVSGYVIGLYGLILLRPKEEDIL